jgi:hypothetical protein
MWEFSKLREVKAPGTEPTPNPRKHRVNTSKNLLQQTLNSLSVWVSEQMRQMDEEIDDWWAQQTASDPQVSMSHQSSGEMPSGG